MILVDFLDALSKILGTKRKQISDIMLTGGAENYTNYQNLVGQVKSLDYIEQEVKDLLEKRKVIEDE